MIDRVGWHMRWNMRTKEEIIDRLKNFEMGWEKPKGATAEFWHDVIALIEKGDQEHENTARVREN